MANIIIVDDHEIFRKGLKSVLTEVENINILADVKSGEEFLEIFEQFEVDVVLMDIRLPGINGLETTKRAFKIKPDLKVLVFSMYDDVEFFNAFIDIGVKGFLLKDAGFSELKKAIIKVYEGDTHFSQSLLVKILKQKNDSVEFNLSEREVEVLNLLAKGYSTNEISEDLFISYRTVERHRANLLAKTDTKNSLQLLIFAIKNNIISI